MVRPEEPVPTIHRYRVTALPSFGIADYDDQVLFRMDLCLVTHSYPPMTGGTAIYVASLAGELVRRGIGVTVLSRPEPGIPESYVHNGVPVVTQQEVIYSRRFDLVVIHAADGPPQLLALANAGKIISPTLYLVVFPQIVPTVSYPALGHVTFAGCSTDDDWKYLSRRDCMHKGRHVRHGANPVECAGTPGRFRKKYGISTRYLFLSCGGFWKHKGHFELAQTFARLEIAAQDVTLVITGYREAPRPSETNGIRVLLLDGEQGRQDMLDAMADADLYIMNSFHEGFGIVLIEAMMNRLPWIARSTVAGATEMFPHGVIYRGEEGLARCLAGFRNIIADRDRVERAYQYAMSERTVARSIDDLLAVANEATARILHSSSVSSPHHRMG